MIDAFHTLLKELDYTDNAKWHLQSRAQFTIRGSDNLF